MREHAAFSTLALRWCCTPAFSSACFEFSTHPHLLVKLGAQRCNLVAPVLLCPRLAQLGAEQIKLRPDVRAPTIRDHPVKRSRQTECKFGWALRADDQGERIEER